MSPIVFCRCAALTLLGSCAYHSWLMRRSLMDLRVSVTGGVHFDLVKRVLRDIKRSGQPPEEIIQQVTFSHLGLGQCCPAAWGAQHQAAARTALAAVRVAEHE